MRNNLHRALACIAGLLLSVLATGSALSAPRSTHARVDGGPISVSGMSVPNFAGVTLDGTAKSVTATMSAFTVNDARGQGFGWNVTVQATQFAEWDPTANGGTGAYVTGGKTMPLSSLTMPTPSVSANGTDSPPPAVTPGPYKIDASGAIKVASAAADTGMGAYDFAQGGPLTLSVPSNAYAKTYRSTVTVSAVSGP